MSTQDNNQKPSFNIRFQPWIDVRYDDNSLRTISLDQFFKDAHHIQFIATSSGIYNYSTLVFLIDIVSSFMKRDTVRDLVQALEAEQFPYGEYLEYMESAQTKYGVTFDIFSEDRPFLQVSNPEFTKENKPKSAKYLSLHYSATHSNVFYSGFADERVSPKRAFLDLLSSIVLARAGGNGYITTPSWFDAIHTFIRGNNMFETLVLNTPADRACQKSKDGRKSYWYTTEWEGVKAKEDTDITFEHCNMYPTRQIRIIPDKDGYVSQASIKAPTTKLHEEVSYRSPYTINMTSADNKPYKLGIKDGEEIWLSMESIININEQDSNAPAIIRQAKLIYDKWSKAEDTVVMRITLYVGRGQKAKIFDFYEEEYNIPRKIIDDPIACATYCNAVRETAYKATCLRQAAQKVYENIADIPEKTKDKNNDGKKTKGMTRTCIESAIIDFYQESRYAIYEGVDLMLKGEDPDTVDKRLKHLIQKNANNAYSDFRYGMRYYKIRDLSIIQACEKFIKLSKKDNPYFNAEAEKAKKRAKKEGEKNVS